MTLKADIDVCWKPRRDSHGLLNTVISTFAECYQHWHLLDKSLNADMRILVTKRVFFSVKQLIFFHDFSNLNKKKIIYIFFMYMMGCTVAFSFFACQLYPVQRKHLNFLATFTKPHGYVSVKSCTRKQNYRNVHSPASHSEPSGLKGGSASQEIIYKIRDKHKVI